MRRSGVGRMWMWIAAGTLSLAAWTPQLHAVPGSPHSPAADGSGDPGVARLAADLRGDLEGILRTALGNWRASRWSVLAVSLDRGDTLFAEGAQDPLAPASNMKLLTSAAAIQQLGPDFRYQTFLLAAGPVRGARLQGDLILYGTGDPGISDRFLSRGRTVFEAFADSLLALGIHVVEGDVVGDGSYFSGPFLGEGWNPNDLNDWFAAPSAALSFNENVFSLRARGSGSAGSAPDILTLPADAGVPILNNGRVGSGPGLTIRRSHPLEPILIQGAIGGGREVWRQMTVPDPAHFSASILRSVLEERGIRVLGTVRAAHDPSDSMVTGRTLWAPALASRPAPRILARHVSPPMRDYLEVVNKRSHNLISDQILKTVGRIVEGEGSFAGGARAAHRFLGGAVGLDPARVTIHDGSGLSALNRMSASDLVALMAYMAREGDWDTFWETLPEAGHPRELRRMSRTEAAGNLRAKTGTIQNVSALSGMVRAANGERIAFSIIANQVASTSGAKGIEDRIGARLAAFDRPAVTAEPPVPVMAEAAPGPPQVPGQERLATAGAETGAGPETGGRGATAGAGAATAAGQASGAEEGARAEAFSEPDAREHRVRPGENFTVIARQYGVPVNALVQANPQLSPRRLQVGARVEIPPPGP